MNINQEILEKNLQETLRALSVERAKSMRLAGHLWNIRRAFRYNHFTKCWAANITDAEADSCDLGKVLRGGLE